MKTPLRNSESESRGWLPGRDCETLRLGVFAWRDWGVPWPGILLRWGAGRQARRLWFAADKIETPASTASPLPTPRFPGYPDSTGMVNNCLLLLSLARRTQGDVETAISGQRFKLPKPPGHSGTEVRTPPWSRLFSLEVHGSPRGFSLFTQAGMGGYSWVTGCVSEQMEFRENPAHVAAF